MDGEGAPAAATSPFTELSVRRLGPVRGFFVRRPVAMDVLVMAWFGVPSVLTAILSPDAPERPTAAVLTTTVALLTLGTAALFWRRRRPLAVAVVMTLLTLVCVGLVGSTQGFELGLALVVYAVAASRPPRIAWTVLAGIDVVVSGGVWLWQDTDAARSTRSAHSASPSVQVGTTGAESAIDTRLMAVLGILALSLAAIAIGISVRNRRLQVAALVEQANALTRDRDQQAQIARAAERTRIAREMHDVVAHSLSVMIALADGAEAALDRTPDRSRTALAELSATGRSALGDMRRVLGVLAHDGAPLSPQPGSTDLDELIDRFRSAGLAVRSEGLNQLLPADAGLQLAVYRIVQEGLTNALRHAPGTAEVRVTLRVGATEVQVDVLDQGATVPVRDAGGAGQGLIGMRERAAVYGGVVEAGPWGAGWRVHAVLPWTVEDA